MKPYIVTVHLNDVEGFKLTAASINKLRTRTSNWIWIIKDGGSHESVLTELEDVVSSLDHLDIHMVSSMDEGIYGAMNDALALIHDEDSFCLFLNSGDSLSDDMIAKWDDILVSNFDFDILYGDHIRIMKGKPVQVKGPESLDMAFLLGKMINHQSIWIRVKWIKLYPFNVRYRIVADWIQLFILLRNEKLQVKYLCFPVCHYAGGGFSEIHDNLRLEERQRFLQSLYSPWELNSLQLLARMRSRRWYPLIRRALDSPMRSRLLSQLSRWIG